MATGPLTSPSFAVSRPPSPATPIPAENPVQPPTPAPDRDHTSGSTTNPSPDDQPNFASEPKRPWDSADIEIDPQLLTPVAQSPLPTVNDTLDTPAPPTSAPVSRVSTPMIKPGTPANGGDGRSPAGESRPLNVTDALSYLDAVKVQFQDKPDVYNHFLDIMKDFKSQVIDTPGVIERVSMLFHGNPYLIQGFNTFLPPGYRIDMSADPHDPNVITVTTPMGTTTQSTNTFGHHPRPGATTPLGTPGAAGFGGNGPIPPLAGGSRTGTPLPYQLGHLQAPFDGAPPLFSPNIQGASTNAAASFLGNLNNRSVEKQAGEFNHAIQYLNKIKARYADDSDKYKNFLEILQTYQKEQRGLNDSQVYMHVQGLFKDAPDLLSEFKDFLPEISGMAAPSGLVGIAPQPSGSGPSGPPWGQADNAPSDKAKKSLPPLKRRKKPVEKDPTPVPPPKPPVNNRSKRAKHHHKGDDSPGFSPYQAPHSPQNGHAAPQPGGFPHAAQLAGPRTMTTPDELMFFERAKKTLESRETYDEFLKLLNLFTKDIIDTRTLIESAHMFLGDGELHAQFKDLMGWDERMHGVEYGPPGSIRTGPPESVQAARVDEGQGVSYRRLPASEINLACSGRDELARSVLNDVWVSHPTWASEDSGFVSHKKTLHEDALHTCEQERHEFDTFIQANARTIAVLEPVWDRLQEMTNEEKAAFRLPPDLGGPTKSIYVRIIKRVYGSTHWEEVWDALQKSPSVAVAVVLDRLHQKDEEWRREQRTWSKIWRGVEAKNHYKALDHLGNNEWKNNEKKSLTTKFLVTDIETRRKAQLRERAAWDAVHKGERRRWFAEGSVGPQLEYTFADISVLHDSLKMVYSFLDHSQALYSQAERRAVETFLRQFVPLLFMCPEGEFNAACGPLEPAHAEEMATDADTNGVDGSRDKSSAASPQPSASENSKSSTADDVWIREAATQTPGTSSSARTVPFFANSTYYTLLRMLQLLYSRLLRCKEIGAEQMAAKYESLTPHPIAVELGLDDSNGPSAILAQAMDALGATGSREETNVLYMYLLDAWEKVFDNELDQATLEEHMRWFFGREAYQVFTLDKVVTGIIKQVQGVLADQKSLDLRSLLENARSTEGISNRDIIRYRREAELNVGSDEHLYRVEWEPGQHSKQMRIQLLGRDDASIEGPKTGVDRWREYVDSYLLTHPTEWLPEVEDDRSGVYLRRCITADETPPSEVHNDIGIQISLGTYKMFYEAGSEDVLWRRRSEAEETRVLERGRRLHEERKSSVWLL